MPTGRHPSGCRPIEFGLFRTLDFRLFLQGRDAGPTGFRRLDLEPAHGRFEFLCAIQMAVPQAERLKPAEPRRLSILRFRELRVSGNLLTKQTLHIPDKAVVGEVMLKGGGVKSGICRVDV